MVVHPRAHKLSESIVCSLSEPAVDGHALRPKADGLWLEVALLEEKKGQCEHDYKQFTFHGVYT